LVLRRSSGTPESTLEFVWDGSQVLPQLPFTLSDAGLRRMSPLFWRPPPFERGAQASIERLKPGFKSALNDLKSF
jgi:hypothetical protein